MMIVIVLVIISLLRLSLLRVVDSHAPQGGGRLNGEQPSEPLGVTQTASRRSNTLLMNSVYKMMDALRGCIRQHRTNAEKMSMAPAQG